LHNVFLMFLVHTGNFSKENIIKSVFWSRLKALNDVWLSFECYVNL